MFTEKMKNYTLFECAKRSKLIESVESGTLGESRLMFDPYWGEYWIWQNIGSGINNRTYDSHEDAVLDKWKAIVRLCQQEKEQEMEDDMDLALQEPARVKYWGKIPEKEAKDLWRSAEDIGLQMERELQFQDYAGYLMAFPLQGFWMVAEPVWENDESLCRIYTGDRDLICQLWKKVQERIRKEKEEEDIDWCGRLGDYRDEYLWCVMYYTPDAEYLDDDGVCCVDTNYVAEVFDLSGLSWGRKHFTKKGKYVA